MAFPRLVVMVTVEKASADSLEIAVRSLEKSIPSPRRSRLRGLHHLLQVLTDLFDLIHFRFLELLQQFHARL